MIFPKLIWLCWIYTHSWTPECSRKQVYRAKPVFFSFFLPCSRFSTQFSPVNPGPCWSGVERALRSIQGVATPTSLFGFSAYVSLRICRRRVSSISYPSNRHTGINKILRVKLMGLKLKSYDIAYNCMAIK